MPIFELPNLVNITFEGFTMADCLQSKSLSAFIENHKKLETLELHRIKLTGDSDDLWDLGYELRNLRHLTYDGTVYKGNFYSTIIADLVQKLENDPKPFNGQVNMQ